MVPEFYLVHAIGRPRGNKALKVQVLVSFGICILYA